MDNYMRVETRLWNYIDGNVDDAEKKEIEQLLQQDEIWKDVYRKLIAAHELMHSDIELEEPSMRFTKNIMEEIGKLKIAPATKAYINKKIINAIAIFFLGLIAVILLYAISQTDFATAATIQYNLDIARFDLTKYYTPATLNILLAMYVIMALVLVDKIFMRRKRLSNGDA